MRIDKIAVLIRMNELNIKFLQDVAREAGINRMTLQKGLAGGSISRTTVKKIADALKVEPYMILASNEEQID